MPPKSDLPLRRLRQGCEKPQQSLGIAYLCVRELGETVERAVVFPEFANRLGLLLLARAMQHLNTCLSVRRRTARRRDNVVHNTCVTPRISSRVKQNLLPSSHSNSLLD